MSHSTYHILSGVVSNFTLQNIHKTQKPLNQLLLPYEGSTSAIRVAASTKTGTKTKTSSLFIESSVPRTNIKSTGCSSSFSKHFRGLICAKEIRKRHWKLINLNTSPADVLKLQPCGGAKLLHANFMQVSFLHLVWCLDRLKLYPGGEGHLFLCKVSL